MLDSTNGAVDANRVHLWDCAKMVSFTLHQLSEQFGISLRKLRAMNSAGALNLSGDYVPKRPAAMRYYLKKDRHLTAEHCVRLLRDPSLYDDLGEYKGKARRQIAALGNVVGEALPDNSAPWLEYAGKGRQEQVDRLAHYIASIVPENGCNYHYVAARLLYHVPDHMFPIIYKVISRAVINARKTPVLADMCGQDQSGMKFFRQSFDL